MLLPPRRGAWTRKRALAARRSSCPATAQSATERSLAPSGLPRPQTTGGSSFNFSPFPVGHPAQEHGTCYDQLGGVHQKETRVLISCVSVTVTTGGGGKQDGKPI